MLREELLKARPEVLVDLLLDLALKDEILAGKLNLLVLDPESLLSLLWERFFQLRELVRVPPHDRCSPRVNKLFTRFLDNLQLLTDPSEAIKLISEVIVLASCLDPHPSGRPRDLVQVASAHFLARADQLDFDKKVLDCVLMIAANAGSKAIFLREIAAAMPRSFLKRLIKNALHHYRAHRSESWLDCLVLLAPSLQNPLFMAWVFAEMGSFQCGDHLMLAKAFFRCGSYGRACRHLAQAWDISPERVSGEMQRLLIRRAPSSRELPTWRVDLHFLQDSQGWTYRFLPLALDRSDLLAAWVVDHDAHLVLDETDHLPLIHFLWSKGHALAASLLARKLVMTQTAQPDAALIELLGKLARQVTNWRGMMSHDTYVTRLTPPSFQEPLISLGYLESETEKAP